MLNNPAQGGNNDQKPNQNAGSQNQPNNNNNNINDNGNTTNKQTGMLNGGVVNTNNNQGSSPSGNNNNNNIPVLGISNTDAPIPNNNNNKPSNNLLNNPPPFINNNNNGPIMQKVMAQPIHLLVPEVEQVVVEPVDHVMEVHSEAVKEEKRPRSFMEQDIEQVKLSGHLQRSLLLAYFC